MWFTRYLISQAERLPSASKDNNKCRQSIPSFRSVILPSSICDSFIACWLTSFDTHSENGAAQTIAPFFIYCWRVSAVTSADPLHVLLTLPTAREDYSYCSCWFTVSVSAHKEQECPALWRHSLLGEVQHLPCWRDSLISQYSIIQQK